MWRETEADGRKPVRLAARLRDAYSDCTECTSDVDSACCECAVWLSRAPARAARAACCVLRTPGAGRAVQLVNVTRDAARITGSTADWREVRLSAMVWWCIARHRGGGSGRRGGSTQQASSPAGGSNELRHTRQQACGRPGGGRLGALPPPRHLQGAPRLGAGVCSAAAGHRRWRAGRRSGGRGGVAGDQDPPCPGIVDQPIRPQVASRQLAVPWAHPRLHLTWPGVGRCAPGPARRAPASSLPHMAATRTGTTAAACARWRTRVRFQQLHAPAAARALAPCPAGAVPGCVKAARGQRGVSRHRADVSEQLVSPRNSGPGRTRLPASAQHWQSCRGRLPCTPPPPPPHHPRACPPTCRARLVRGLPPCPCLTPASPSSCARSASCRQTKALPSPCLV